MPYGTIKVDNITFDNGGTDKLLTVSGLFFSTSGALTVTGTISGGNVTAPTATFTTLTGTTTAGTTATFTSGSFTSLTGVTTTVTSGVFGLGSAAAPSIAFSGDTNNGIYSPGADQVAISTSGTGRLFIDSLGRLLAGTSTARSNFFGTTLSSVAQIEGTGGASGRGALSVINNDVSNNPPYVLLGRSGAATLGSNTVVVNGSRLGTLTFHGADGTSFIEAATVAGEVDGTPGSNDMPGRLVFSTTADGAASPTERLRITSAGLVGLGTNDPQQELHINDATGVSRIRLSGGAASADNFDIGQSVPGVSNSGFSIYDVDATASRLVIDSLGNVGIGTTGPASIFQVRVAANQNIAFNQLASEARITCYNDAVAAASSLGLNGSDLRFQISDTERARIDSSGRLLVGTSSARGNFYNTSFAAGFQIESVTNVNRGIALINNSSATGSGGDPPSFILARSGGTAIGSNTAVSSDMWLGNITFQGNDGTEFVEGARIDAYVDGTPSANDMPGRLVFSTTADGAASPTERLRIGSNGSTYIGTTNELPASNDVDGATFYRATGLLQLSRFDGEALSVNRRSNDGNLVEFKQAGTTEGTISVSGTTVSYNGAHLSRWSQLLGGATRKEILRGTVLSNIDEMCGWGDEENEQLNRMKVSDVEGDKNVSGVFQAWDDDDDTYVDDFYCAMTGDFIIRIAEGVTVERGDLLMSAGDGTAKPQDDDIIRSKTIAKVTSTYVTCTYEDGSYCVPCVLMAC